MTRLVVSGPAVAQFAPDPFTDTYVKIVFPPPGEAMAPGACAKVIVEGTDAADVQPLPAVADAEIRWLHLPRERGVAKELLSISGYWRRGLNDDQWRGLTAARTCPTDEK